MACMKRPSTYTQREGAKAGPGGVGGKTGGRKGSLRFASGVRGGQKQSASKTSCDFEAEWRSLPPSM